MIDKKCKNIIKRLKIYAFDKSVKFIKQYGHTKKDFLQYWKQIEWSYEYTNEYSFGKYQNSAGFKNIKIKINNKKILSRKDYEYSLLLVITHEVAHFIDVFLKGSSCHDLHFLHIWMTLMDKNINLKVYLNKYKKEIY